MRWATLISMVFMFLGAAACAQSEANTNGPDTKACAALAGARKHPWSVNSAEFIHSPFTVTIKGGHDTGKTVTVSVPFCRITGMVKPTRESDIRFEAASTSRLEWQVRGSRKRRFLRQHPIPVADARCYARIRDSGN